MIILIIEDDHFDDWRWSLYTAHLADQAILRVKRIVRASWLDRLEVHTAHLGLGEEPWSRSWNYHRAILIMIQRLFSPTILFLVWWHVCTSRTPPLPPCMCTPPYRTSHIFYVLIHIQTNLMRDKVQTIRYYMIFRHVSVLSMSFNPNSGLIGLYWF